MEYALKHKLENPLLSRKRLTIEIRHLGMPSPSYEAVKKEIASQEKADPKLIIIRNIYPAFGGGKSEVLAFVYDSEEALLKSEPQEVKKRKEAGKKAAEEAKKAAEAKKAEAKSSKEAEKPAEAEKPKKGEQ